MNVNLYKVDGKILRDANWNLKLDFKKAMDKDFIIAFSSSQVIDWIYELRGTTYRQASETYSELKGLLKQGKGNPKELRNQMHELNFIDELIQVEFSSKSDFNRAVQGLKVNGISYKYLSSKGSNVITFIKEDLYDIISKRLNADRDVNVKQYPSKLNAYKSLAFSTSEVVTTPNKVIVIPDCNVQFQAEYLWVDEDVEYKNEIVERDVNDGYCFISPELAEQWTKDLNHEGILSAFQIRTLWAKGVLVPVDYKTFCIEYGVTTVVDVWGNEQNILDADIILSESLVKLWNSYSSCEDWLNAIDKHNYSWRVSKYSHKHKFGYTNYQQMLPLDLDINDIDELLQPSINHLKAINTGDYVSTCLYLNGNQTESMLGDKSLSTALQIEPALLNDSYLKRRVNGMISKTKNDIKLGRMSVDASFQIIVGDVVQLLQHLVGVENPKGVLGKYEIYSTKHKNGTVAVASRCPLLVANNLVKVTTRNDMGKYQHYFQYLNDIYVVDGCSLLNESLCGFDFDGDTLQLITEDVIVRNTKNLLPIKCAGISGKKEVIKDDKPLITASGLMCGKSIPQIGAVINDASKMFSVMGRYEVGSKEYEEMNNRLIQMVKISQSVIDAKKSGNYFKTPKHWVSADACKEIFTGEELEFNLKLVADKRPYFFIHNYDKDKKEFQQFKEFVNVRSLAHWHITADELLSIDKDTLTEEQRQFLDYASARYCKLSLNDGSTMWKLTNRADERLREVRTTKNGINTKNLLKSDIKVDTDIMRKVKTIYNRYNTNLRNINKTVADSLMERQDKIKNKTNLIEELQMNILAELLQVADKETVCNALIDITYDNNYSCSLVWDLFGDVIINNLLERNGKINLIEEDINGEHYYKGKSYSIVEKGMID